MPATPAECEGFADLLDALADAELPPATARAVAVHVAGCAACAAALAATRGLRAELATLRADAAPPALRARLAAQARQAPPPARRRLLEALAAGLGGLVIGSGGLLLLGGGGLADAATHDLLAAHARSLLAEAPPQVPSGDPHRIRPWLSARLATAPRVEEIPGFPLLGARLDLVASRPVAALLYRRRQHAITVFAAPAETTRDWPAAASRGNGFRLLPWVADGVRYVAVSDLGAAELADFATLLGAPAP
jgi:anti-sigma factor RsiW